MSIHLLVPGKFEEECEEKNRGEKVKENQKIYLKSINYFYMLLQSH